ncbi:MAG: hypothetical protein H6Q51_1550 [Deltaproteobacteria bacterium]|nr:hypothetical protein [Deltaproteobacteria bacterium]
MRPLIELVEQARLSDTNALHSLPPVRLAEVLKDSVLYSNIPRWLRSKGDLTIAARQMARVLTAALCR